LDVKANGLCYSVRQAFEPGQMIFQGWKWKE
jgi:hypothetical protein